MCSRREAGFQLPGFVLPALDIREGPYTQDVRFIVFGPDLLKPESLGMGCPSSCGHQEPSGPKAL